jgi:hypothetical protein
MKWYFVKMQDPNDGRFFNVGDFQKLEDAIYDAETCKYPARVYEVTEHGSKLLVTTEKNNTHE